MTLLLSRFDTPPLHLLDDFNRADSNLAAPWITPSQDGGDTGKIVSNQVGDPVGIGAAICTYGLSQGPDVFVAVDVPVLASATHQMELAARTNIANPPTQYKLRVTPSTALWELRYRLAAGSVLITSGTWTINAGDSFGLYVFGTVVQGWYKASGGSWQKILDAIDTHVSPTATPNYVSLGIYDTVARFDNFLVSGFADAVTAVLSLTPSTAQEGIERSDAATEALLLTPSGADTAQFVDAQTEALALTPSASDIAQFVDSNTESYKLTPSGTDTAQFADSATESLLLIPSGSDIGQFVDSGIEGLSLVPSGSDVAAYVESATESLHLSPSASDIAIFVDSGREDFALVPSAGVETAQFVDGVTELFKFTPSADEQVSGGATDAGTGTITLVPLSSDALFGVDAGTEVFTLSPLATDVTDFTDSGREDLSLSPSGVELAQFTEAAVELFKFTPSGSEFRTGVGTLFDAGTLYLKLTPGGFEIYKLVQLVIRSSIRRWIFSADRRYSMEAFQQFNRRLP